MLTELRKRLADNVNHMHSEALQENSEGGNELSDMPLEHLADRGSETFARDLMISILQSSEAQLVDIDDALEKIDNDQYGVCEECGGEIRKARLKALPFARLCIKCKESEESAG